MLATTSAFPEALLPSHVTILSYGALTSEASARLTFPDLKSFRHVQVKQYRRVFAHPHLFLLSKGLIDPSTSLELASLSIEPDQESKFIAVAFEVALDDSQRAAFVARAPISPIDQVIITNDLGDRCEQLAGNTINLDPGRPVHPEMGPLDTW